MATKPEYFYEIEGNNQLSKGGCFEMLKKAQWPMLNELILSTLFVS